MYSSDLVLPTIGCNTFGHFQMVFVRSLSLSNGNLGVNKKVLPKTNTIVVQFKVYNSRMHFAGIMMCTYSYAVPVT